MLKDSITLSQLYDLIIDRGIDPNKIFLFRKQNKEVYNVLPIQKENIQRESHEENFINDGSIITIESSNDGTWNLII